MRIATEAFVRSMLTGITVSIVLSIPAVLGGCDDKSSTAPAASSTAASVSAAPAASGASAAPAASASAAANEDSETPLELRELTFTSNVENKEPVDVLLAAEPGERVWAHLRVRNRNDEPRKVHLEFRVNDDKRTTLDLKVSKSWSFRTWAYNTLLASDKTGEVSLTVTDDEGRVLAETSVPIAPKARTKPYAKKPK
ncbi:MAG: hypothetical protein ACOC1F_12230 [Myxococcota bacterium]